MFGLKDKFGSMDIGLNPLFSVKTANRFAVLVIMCNRRESPKTVIG